LKVYEIGRHVRWVDSHENETVKAFKKKYATLRNMDPDDLRLDFGLKHLNDNMTLKEEGLTTGKKVTAKWSSPHTGGRTQGQGSRAIRNTLNKFLPSTSTFFEPEATSSDIKHDFFDDWASMDTSPTSDVMLTLQRDMTAVDIPNRPDAALPEQVPSPEAVEYYSHTFPDATPSSLYLTSVSFDAAPPSYDASPASSMKTSTQDKPASSMTTPTSPDDSTTSSMTVLTCPEEVSTLSMAALNSPDDVPASPTFDFTTWGSEE
jgi:hypothetical protein